jgi:MFS family permease
MAIPGIALPQFDRRLIVLSIAQMVTGSALPVFFLITGLIGARLAPELRLSTLPMSVNVISIALSSALAGATMKKLGRKRGHLLGILITSVGAAIGAFALTRNSFEIYCFACIFVGIGFAFNNQIRFTAAEGAGDKAAAVHSWILTVTLVCAILGPWIAQVGRTASSSGEYVGSLLILLALLAGAFLTMLAFPAAVKVQAPTGETLGGNLGLVIRHPKFWLAAAGGMGSFATMSLLMSATPLQMSSIEHFSVNETTRTIQSHIVAMYLPSLFSGFLLFRLGVRRMFFIGVALFVVCITLAYHSSHFHHYWWALVLLGVAWNFLFVASSTTISISFTGSERFTAQGTNDAIVFGTQAIASLSAGWLLFEFGWTTLVLVPLPLLAVVTALALRDGRSRD